ncbi:hypothetical protein [Flagellimonas nanhaiensis]|uniref:Alpha/beta hydrolase n=1 Tax=Flagellimonas nanhaiensis TaxID=2292706 RepID=A0A371JRP7_9FLAO|nr:hypothetical protein [Allomuricauda nanhaiensis]RDY60181.1 hypothetical protein DX873_12695 [Allomuricauda nanhaiensis]
MKCCPKTRKINLLILLGISITLFSCSKDDDNFISGYEGGEVMIKKTASDTIIHAIVGKYKVPIYLSFPKDCDNKDYPAVVVLHGSDGMWKDHDSKTGTMSGQNKEWRELFDENCIAGAYVDSYSGRGVTTRTGKWKTAPDNFKISSQFIRPKDATIALELLKNLKFEDGSSIIRAKDIALLGFSDGASAVAATLYDTKTTPNDWQWNQSFEGKSYDTSSGVLPPDPRPESGFAGGIFYYGGSMGYGYWGTNACSDDSYDKNIYRTYAPMLFQIPEEGYLTENTLCLIDLLEEKGDDVELNLYQGVGHGFDFEGVEQSQLARENSINWLKDLLHMN